ncbi:MAG: PilZ domain-containing protein [Sphingomonas bacterium]|nr:PilZ domain-containing protein [Sphingomonas bacterium]
MNAPVTPIAPRIRPKATSTDPVGSPRRSRRLKVFLPSEIVIDDAAVRAHVLDISTRGSLLHTGTEPEPGSDVVLRLNQDKLSAKIVWVGSGRLGIQFTTELTDDQIARILDDPSEGDRR